MSMHRDFKGVWIPKNVWLSKDLTMMEKLFLVEIDSLDNEDGCFASNAHFSEFFGLSKSRCTEIIKTLEQKEFVNVKLKKEGKRVVKRVIKILPNPLFGKPNTPIRKTEHPYSENRTPLFGKPNGNNTIVNNTKGEYENAFSFLKKNHEIVLEQKILMRYKSQIKDWVKFIQQYNNAVDIEDIEFTSRKLLARLDKFAVNWISNQDRFSNKDEEKEPAYLRNKL